MTITSPASIMAVRTAMTRQDISANDIANVNTPGYREKTPIQTDLSPQGVGIAAIRSTPNPSSEFSGTDLVEEIKEQMVNKNTLTANLNVLKVKDRMIGEVLDLLA